MKGVFDKRRLIAWLLLVAITLLYPLIDHAADKNGTLTASTFLTVAAICLACVKLRVIFREFMGVRSAPALLCRITDLWVVLIASVLIATYLAGRAVA